MNNKVIKGDAEAARIKAEIDKKASFGEYGDFTKDADERIYKMINYDERFEKDIEELVCEEGSIFVVEK